MENDDAVVLGPILSIILKKHFRDPSKNKVSPPIAQ